MPPVKRMAVPSGVSMPTMSGTVFVVLRHGIVLVVPFSTIGRHGTECGLRPKGMNPMPG